MRRASLKGRNNPAHRIIHAFNIQDLARGLVSQLIAALLIFGGAPNIYHVYLYVLYILVYYQITILIILFESILLIYSHPSNFLILTSRSLLTDLYIFWACELLFCCTNLIVYTNIIYALLVDQNIVQSGHDNSINDFSCYLMCDLKPLIHSCAIIQEHDEKFPMMQILAKTRDSEFIN